MFMKFIEIYRKDQSSREFCLRDVFINTDFVVSAAPEENIKHLIHEFPAAKVLSEDVSYTRLFLNRGNIGHEIIIIESFDNFVSKVANIQNKMIQNVLKG